MTLGSARPFLEAVRDADEVLVYEGLPHPAWEPELQAVESRRPDLLRLLDYPFYAQPLPVTDDDLRRLTEVALRSESHVRVRGIKLCGGYHPDYAIVWRSGAKTSGALICFGCHEWKIFTGEGRYYQTISDHAYADFHAVLAKYVARRPQPVRRG